MYLSLKVLEDLIKLPKNIKVEDLAKKLTMHTVEVESWRNLKDDFNNIVVGQVLSVAPHPKADRLKLAKVDIKSEILSIVCGGPNLKEKQKVAIALLGSVLPNGLKIEKAVIRGEESSGMICSESELGLGEDHEGILVLSSSAKVGQSLSEHLGLEDIILEIDNKSLSNRGDLLSHYGLARELSVIYKTDLKDYKFKKPKLNDLEKNSKLKLSIEDKNICSRYIAARISNIEVKESPLWLKRRLIALGSRPVNNLVDIGNYVMFETGQPLHFFDAAKVSEIRVRQSKEGEGIKTLDSKDRLVPKGSILISDQKEAIALAGIMGGEGSAISKNSKEVIIESATFDPVLVRKSSQALNLRSEASTRFEKTLDPNLADLAWQRAWQLISELIPEAKLEELVRKDNANNEEKLIDFDFLDLKKKLNIKISKREAINILERLGFKLSVEKNNFSAIIPSWRAVKDISIKEDIYEEIARIYGYDNIESSSIKSILSYPEENSELALERKIKNILSGSARFNEIVNYSFLSEANLVKLNFNTKHCLSLSNSLSDQYSFLRPSLVVGLAQNIRLNQFNYNEIKIFELGRVFLKSTGKYKPKADSENFLPYQGKRLALAIAGNDPASILDQLKASLGLLFSKLFPGSELSYLPSETKNSWSAKPGQVKIILSGHDLGDLGFLDDKLASNFNLKLKLILAEINFQELFKLFKTWPQLKYQEAAKYPAVFRDMSFVLNEKIIYNDFVASLKSFNELISDVRLIDSYQGRGIAKGKKGWTFHISYQAKDRTLRTEEVNDVQLGLIKHCRDLYDAELRDLEL